MPYHKWKVRIPLSTQIMYITMTDGGSGKTNFYFTPLWRIKINLLNAQRGSCFIADGSLHALSFNIEFTVLFTILLSSECTISYITPMRATL